MMNSRIAWLMMALMIFSVLLIAADHSIEARKDPGEYWISVMKEQPMPEALQVLVPELDSSPSQLNKNADDCHTSELGVEINKLDQLVEDFKHKDHDHKQHFVKDFEPRPNVSPYDGDDIVGHESEKKFVKDFEPRPKAYTDDLVQASKERTFAEEFEQAPDASIYHN
ncbi:organ-specific protein P4-like [Juglans microcarpa x Juglans regia]|uniref:organ-specific protein P4-like n=1 Tax=Juglans microcarpa x Juglans regia TaxID=2249226 RepID=UPI001B7EF0E9|nr:organ-specific protein P4-like [Juglans microcarpa x Juglans regia]